ncbi:NAD-dependent dehydratase [Luteolibacter luteus]|uniref:NAD-dependent dehydratase n=1 Tax=Luteolibacter luteus TaxID=2728835 RepID=A0A858RN66_9BACT|nr:NAD-dependent dehydratase [Luteolibacter luteus]QJE97799.1 NAD-dependent dehydratase [Luteolibacter luteus]
MATVLVAGATGLVGSEVLRLALADKQVERVVAPTRRALPAHPRLENPVVEYQSLSGEEPWWDVDAVICALGSTIRKAGSQEAFKQIDHGFPLKVAVHALENGARSYALNSSVGADPGSRNFYLRTKGEVERDLDQLGYCSITIVRPSVIWGARKETRLGESLAVFALTAMRPVVPRRYRVVPAARIAKALLRGAIAGIPGKRVLESEEI